MTGGGEDAMETARRVTDAIKAWTADLPGTLLDVLDAAGLEIVLSPPPPVWVPLAEAQPADGQEVWVSDGCGVWFSTLRTYDGGEWALTGSYWVDHDDSLVAALSWVPASVPEPPEEGEVER